MAQRMKANRGGKANGDGKPQVGGLDQKKLEQFAARIGASKQELDDTRMAHAEIYKEVEEAGFHRAALKLTLKLKSQDAAKTADFLRAFELYCHALGVDAQIDLFEQGKDRKAQGESIAEASQPAPPA